MNDDDDVAPEPDDSIHAEVHIELDQHPDAAELRDRLAQVLEEGHTGSVIDVRFEDRSMSRSRRVLVGSFLSALAIGLLAVLPWIWSSASRAIATGSPVSVHVLGAGFHLSEAAALVLVTTAMGMIGSVVVLLLTFANRAVHETLERGALWWYLTRPFSGALLGLLFYLAVIAGFFSASATSGRPALIVAAAVGALAGLFTDQVIKKMQRILGLLPFGRSSTGTTASSGDT